MVTFEQFVKSLGPYAKRYTPEELEQLQIEVRRLARFLIAAHKASRPSSRGGSSPQDAVDDAGGDRTMVQTVTEHDDERDSAHAHPT